MPIKSLDDEIEEVFKKESSFVLRHHWYLWIIFFKFYGLVLGMSLVKYKCKQKGYSRIIRNFRFTSQSQTVKETSNFPTFWHWTVFKYYKLAISIGLWFLNCFENSFQYTHLSIWLKARQRKTMSLFIRDINWKDINSSVTDIDEHYTYIYMRIYVA